MMLAIAAASCGGQDNPTAPTSIAGAPTEATAIAATATDGRNGEPQPAGLQTPGNGSGRSALTQSDNARCRQIHHQLSRVVGDRRSGPSITKSEYIYQKGAANDSLRFAWGPPSWLEGQVIGYWHRVRRLQPGPAESWPEWTWGTTTSYSQDGLNEPSPWGPGDTPKYNLQVRVCHKTSGTVYVHRRKSSAGSVFKVQ